MQFCRKQKMLASTMQFSRYGRNHASGPPIRKVPTARPFESAPTKAAASSGPNSVLTQRGGRRARSARRRGGGVLAARSRPGRMNSQCSTRKHGRPVTHSVTRGAGAP